MNRDLPDTHSLVTLTATLTTKIIALPRKLLLLVPPQEQFPCYCDWKSGLWISTPSLSLAPLRVNIHHSIWRTTPSDNLKLRDKQHKHWDVTYPVSTFKYCQSSTITGQNSTWERPRLLGNNNFITLASKASADKSTIVRPSNEHEN